jgi:hypothetical protein
MQEIHNEVNIGLKFKLADLVNQMTESNYATYIYILHKVNISDESTDEVNSAYKDIIHNLDLFFEKDEFLERITNAETEHFGNVNILEYNCVLEVKQIHYGQQSFNPRGNNVQIIPMDVMMRAMNEEVSVVDDNKRQIDLALLPPYEKVISLFTELIE